MHSGRVNHVRNKNRKWMKSKNIGQKKTCIFIEMCTHILYLQIIEDY